MLDDLINKENDSCTTEMKSKCKCQEQFKASTIKSYSLSHYFVTCKSVAKGLLLIL